MLQSGRPRFRVGIRFPAWATGFAFALFEGLLEFQRGGFRFELHFDQPSGGDLDLEIIDESWIGDGLLVFRHTKAEAKAWRRKNIAVVNLSAETPGKLPEFPRVTMDNHAVGREALAHLAALGLRDFAYIHESTRTYSGERLEGFREAVSQARGRLHVIDIPVSSYPTGTAPACIEQAIFGPLAALPRPCGVLTKDDIGAVWTLRAMKKLGIRCPDEMPLIGVDDDMVFCQMTDPPASSVSYPGRTIGLAASRLLHRMMTGEIVAADHRILIPPGPVVARESTRRVVLPDPVVTKALDYLREHGGTASVRVADLAKHAGVSRELLRQRFHEVLHRSPKQEIERMRCHWLCETLRNGNSTLEQIAEIGDFTGPHEVCRFIKRKTGRTPGEIRRGILPIEVGRN